MVQCTRCQKTSLTGSAGWQTYSGGVVKSPVISYVSGYAEPVTYCPECNRELLNLVNEYTSAILQAYNVKRNSGLPPEKMREEINNIILPIRRKVFETAGKDFDNGVIMDMTFPYVMQYSEVFDLVRDPSPGRFSQVQLETDQSNPAYWIQRGQIRKCIKMGSKAVIPLIEVLKDSNNENRKDAIEALGKIGDPRAIQTLTEALNDKDYYLRESAAKALKMIKSKN